MKKHSKIFVALLAVAVLISALTIALVACNTNKDDGGNAGRIGESGYYEGKVTANELLTYGKAMFGSESAEGNSKSMSITYASEHDELGPIWMINFDVYGDEMDDEAIIYVTDSNEDAKQLYQLENDEASDWDDEFVINKVVGNRVIKETKQDLIKNNLLVDLQTDEIPNKFVNLMKSSFNEAMDNLSFVENSNDREYNIYFMFEEFESEDAPKDMTLFHGLIPTSSVGNCEISYCILPPDMEDDLEECKKLKKLIGTKYTSDSYIEEEGDYMLIKLETQPGFVFEDILDANGDLTGEVALVDYYYNNDEGRQVIIPSTDQNGNLVTYIGSGYAIFDDGIKSVTIPTSVKTINEYAFGHCAGLIDVTIPDSVQSIGENAFYDCTGLQTATIGENVTSIGGYAFCGCENLQTVMMGDSVVNIEEGVFLYCADLTEIIIPESVTRIGDRAFYHCTGLQTITIGDDVQSIGYNAFSECTGLKAATINAKSIAMGAFSDCAGLQTVTIGDDVQSIGYNAFYNCTGITKVNYLGTFKGWCETDFGYDGNPLSVTNFEAQLYCNGEIVDFTNLNIPAGTTKIGKYAFSKCTGFSEITIPDSVQSIGEGAFYGCEEMRTVTIGKGVQSIGAYAFSGCTGLQTVYYEGTREQWNDIAISNMYDDNHAFIYFVTRYYFSEQDPYANHTAKEGEQYWHWDEETHTPEVWVKQD